MTTLLGNAHHILVVLLLSVCIPVAWSLEILHHTARQSLTQVTVGSGGVYVGGVNNLLHLEPNLTLVNSISLGPIRDDASCDPLHDCPAGILTDNEVKVLEIDDRKLKLLMCGSVKLGICQLHSLSNIAMHSNSTSSTPPNLLGSKRSVAAVFGRDVPADGGSTLFVGQEYDGRNVSRSPIVLSTRVIEESGNGHQINYLTYDEALEQISGLGIFSTLKPDYHMEFVDVFQHDSFVYFLTVQQKSVRDSTTPYSRLGRICAADEVYVSYVETGLVCRASDGTEYPKILSATVEDNVLYFSAAYVDVRNPQTFETDESRGSVVCSISMADLDTQFVNINYDCFEAGSKAGIAGWKAGNDDSACRYVNIGAVSIGTSTGVGTGH